MNKDHILFQLKEAQEAIAQTIADFEGEPEYEEANLQVDLGHIYHHLNSAWNARNESPAKTSACADSDFKEWRQFPRDIDLST